jgi:hypothetical protein
MHDRVLGVEDVPTVQDEHLFARLFEVDLGNLDGNSLENLRRSIVMLPPGQPGLDRDAAIKVIEELERLQHNDRRHRVLVDQLRLLLESTEP